MRSATVIAIMMLGCGGKPSPPDAKKYAAMSEQEKCKATEPRATQCIDELLAMSVRDLAALGVDREFTDAVEKDLEGQGRADEAQAKQLHLSLCVGDRTTAYMDAIVECWAVEHCKDFANCVSAAQRTAK